MDLEQRLARLERANRRMKRIGALVLVVAAAVVLSGAADGKDLPDLEVRSLTLKDKDGKTRAMLSVFADKVPRLALYDKDGKTRAALVVVPEGSPGLVLYDKDGTPRVHLSVAVLDLSDKDGKTRATLGASTTVRWGGVRTTAESTLTLFDAKGNVIWKAPR